MRFIAPARRKPYAEIFRGSFPEVEDRVAELLTHAEFREDIRDRLEALAEVYQEDHSVMRFSFYHPERMAELFEKLTREAVPFRSVPGFAWNEQEVFITEDEIDAFLASGGPVSEGRLATYSFFLQHEDGKERADFLKRQYGDGGRSHALSGADHTDANYSGKGIRLTKRTYSENEIECTGRRR